MAVSSLTGIDESALVTQAREGDTTAFAELVRRYEGKIFRLAQHVTQNREDAEDVLQETFMKAYEHLDQFKGDSKFYTWIVRIAVNQALMKLRRRRTDKSVSMDETIDTGEDTVVRCERCARGRALVPRRECRRWLSGWGRAFPRPGSHLGRRQRYPRPKGQDRPACPKSPICPESQLLRCARWLVPRPKNRPVQALISAPDPRPPTPWP